MTVAGLISDYGQQYALLIREPPPEAPPTGCSLYVLIFHSNSPQVTITFPQSSSIMLNQY